MNARHFLFLTLCAIAGAYSVEGRTQAWSGIVAPDRAVDWSAAGVAGGIPNRNTICATLNPGATLAQINSAIAACPSGQVVFLNAGTYNLGSGMIEIRKSNVTVRGAGANQTKLYFTGRGNCGGIPSVLCINGSWIQGGYGSAPQNLANWTAGYAKGSTVLTFSNTAGLAPGTRVILDQLNDTADSDGVYVCGTGQVCGYTSHGGDSRPSRFQQQIVTVASVSGNQVTITQPIHMPNWRAERSPGARWTSGVTRGSGFENLSIDLMAANNTGGTQSNVAIMGVTDSWVKGVRSIMGDRSHVQVYQSARVTIRDSYFYGSFNGVQTSYGIEAFGASSDLLVENNMFQHNTNPLIVNDGGSGSVYGYNFSIDNFRSSPSDLMVATFQVHSPGTGMILVEGNDGLAAAADNWYGTVHFMTFFRNHFYGDIHNDPVKSSQTWVMQIAAYSRFFNFVGNVLGRTGYYNTYEPTGAIGCGPRYIWCWGYSHATGGVTDAQTKPRAMRWGNYDTVTGTVRFAPSEVPSALSQFANPVPASQALPASFYLPSRPQWFGGVSWPPIGPEVTGGNIAGYAGHANKIPARLCWENSPIDAEYGSRNVRTFNPNNCYSGVGDPTSPTVSITAPTAAATVSGSTVISANASDNIGVAGVQFKLDGVNLGSEDTISPYSLNWDTTQTANGNHVLTAVARDAAGNTTASAPVSVTVSNAIVTLPPGITSHPMTQVAGAGSTANFSVAASGTAPLAYQWKKNGLDIAGATASSYTTPALSLADNASSYSVAVSNSAGSVTSNAASLFVSEGRGAVASYNFDEGSGTMLTDRSGNGRHGTVANATWNTTGKSGGSLTFNGTNALVTIADSNSLDFTDGMTLEAWVYPTAPLISFPTVILKERTGGLAYALYANSNNAAPSGWVYTNAEYGTAGSSQLPQNTWTHLAVTYDGSALRFYVNGSLSGNSNVTGNIVNSTGPLRIGGNSIWPEYFTGRIDDVRIYSRALSQAEIQADMGSAVLPPAPGSCS